MRHLFPRVHKNQTTLGFTKGWRARQSFPPLPPAFALPSSPLPPFSGLVSPSSLDDRVSKSLLPKFAQQCLSLRLRLSYFNGLRIDTKPMMQPGSKQTDGKISRQDAKPLRKELEAEHQIPTELGVFCDL